MIPMFRLQGHGDKPAEHSLISCVCVCRQYYASSMRTSIKILHTEYLHSGCMPAVAAYSDRSKRGATVCPTIMRPKNSGFEGSGHWQ